MDFLLLTNRLGFCSIHGLLHNLSLSWLFFSIFFNRNATGFSKTETVTLLQTSCLVGSREIFSATSMSSARTEPKTVYAFFHSTWLAKLMKNSGPEPTHAIDPLLMVGQNSVGTSLKMVPWASSVPCISPKGGPN